MKLYQFSFSQRKIILAFWKGAQGRGNNIMSTIFAELPFQAETLSTPKTGGRQQFSGGKKNNTLTALALICPSSIQFCRTPPCTRLAAIFLAKTLMLSGFAIRLSFFFFFFFCLFFISFFLFRVQLLISIFVHLLCFTIFFTADVTHSYLV